MSFSGYRVTESVLTDGECDELLAVDDEWFYPEDFERQKELQRRGELYFCNSGQHKRGQAALPDLRMW